MLAVFPTIPGKRTSLWKIMEMRNWYGLFQEGQAYIIAGYNTGYWLRAGERWVWNGRQESGPEGPCVPCLILLALTLKWQGSTEGFFFNVSLLLWDRERQSMRMGETERERETQNLKQAPEPELSAQSLKQGTNSQTTRPWPELKLDA